MVGQCAIFPANFRDEEFTGSPPPPPPPDNVRFEFVRFTRDLSGKREKDGGCPAGWSAFATHPRPKVRPHNSLVAGKKLKRLVKSIYGKMTGFFMAQKEAQFVRKAVFLLSKGIKLLHFFNVSHSKRQAQLFFLNKNALIKK